MKKDLETAKRAERAARRRAARQHRTLLQLHARLLLARWRMDSAALACAISRGNSHGIRRRLRCRSALQKWREGLLYAGVWGRCARRAAAHRAALMRASGLALLRRRLRERADARRRLTTLVRRVLRKKQKGALRAWRGVVMRGVAAAQAAARAVRLWHYKRLARMRRALGDWRRWRAAYGAVAPTPAARCGSGAAPHARHSGFRWGGASRRRAARACGGGHWSAALLSWRGELWRRDAVAQSRRLSARRAHRALMRKWFRRCRAVTAYIGAVRAAALTLSEALSSHWLRRAAARWAVAAEARRTRAASPASALPGTGGGGLTTCAPRSWRTRRRRCTRRARPMRRGPTARAPRCAGGVHARCPSPRRRASRAASAFASCARRAAALHRLVRRARRRRRTPSDGDARRNAAARRRPRRARRGHGLRRRRAARAPYCLPSPRRSPAIPSTPWRRASRRGRRSPRRSMRPRTRCCGGGARSHSTCGRLITPWRQRCAPASGRAASPY